MSDDKCCCMISDTIHVWAEGSCYEPTPPCDASSDRGLVLSAAQFARRWTMCNPNYPIEMLDGLAYRVRDTIPLLAAAHTFSGMNEMNFEVMESPACVCGRNVLHSLMILTSAYRTYYSSLTVKHLSRPRRGRGDGKVSMSDRKWLRLSYRNTSFCL
jgi:hypothetical protein